MSSDCCKYHSAAPAVWRCEHCPVQWCQRCYPALPQVGVRRHCPLCRQPMRYLGAANSAEPFWQRMPDFFLYPLQLQPLLLLGLVTLAAFILPASLLGVGLAILFLALVLRYNCLVLERRSLGDRQAPAVMEVVGGQDHIFLKLVGVYLGYGLLASTLGRWGVTGAITGWLLFYIVSLASVMLLATSRSLRTALNPVELASLIGKLGWTYVAMFLVISLISAGPGYIVGLLAGQGEQLSQLRVLWVQAGLAASFTYFNIVTFALMGYVLYQRQGELGYFALEEAEEAPDERELELAQADIFLREGRYEDAARFLAAAMEEYPDDLDIRERYQRLLVARGEREKWLQHTPRLLVQLLNARQDRRAAEVYLELLGVESGYRPPQLQVRLLLAKELFRMGRHKPAAFLLHNAHKEWPGNPELADAYFLAAKVYAEGLNEDRKGLQLLQYLTRTFPDHRDRSRWEEYRQTLTRLMTP